MYKDMIKSNYSKVKGDDAVMWASVALVDELLEEMREHHKERYWRFMRDTHELMFGRHFDKMYAEWEVEQMHHKGKDGRVHKGERWSCEDASVVMTKYRSILPSEITPCDFYVAINATWHDYICWAMEHFGGEAEAENAIIDMAVRFWFMDDDWGDSTKIWEYFRAKDR